MSPAPTPYMGRRGSLAESIEVTIEVTETTTYIPPPTPTASTFSNPTPWSTSPPSLSTFPLTNSPPYPAATTTPFSPPPTYTFSQPTITVTPLSFFPSGTEPATVASVSAPPPAYRTVPRTRAETLFWRGLLLPLLFWPWGILHLWRAERPEGWSPEGHGGKAVLDEEASIEMQEALQIDGTRPGFQGRAPTVAESLAVWREEEVLWAKRCAYCLGGFVAVASVFVVVVIHVADVL